MDKYTASTLNFEPLFFQKEELLLQLIQRIKKELTTTQRVWWKKNNLKRSIQNFDYLQYLMYQERGIICKGKRKKSWYL